MADPVAVGVDIGGTKLVAAAVAADGTVVERARRTSPEGDATALVAVVTELVRELHRPGLPVGAGVAGIVTLDGTLRYAPNLDVRDVPLRHLLEERLGVTVVVANDATVALFGELQAGAGRDCDDVVMLTVGTGVGGAIAVGGNLVHGAGGYAGELGHIVVDEGGRRCPCGNRGCLEAYASGTAIGKRAAALVAEDADRVEGSSLVSIDEIDGRAVTEAAHAGDEFAQQVLREAGHWLGVGLVTLVNALDPARVVVGGGASTRAGVFMLPEAGTVLAERIMGGGLREPPPVVRAELDDDAGMVGAALLARRDAG